MCSPPKSVKASHSQLHQPWQLAADSPSSRRGTMTFSGTQECSRGVALPRKKQCYKCCHETLNEVRPSGFMWLCNILSNELRIISYFGNKQLLAFYDSCYSLITVIITLHFGPRRKQLNKVKSKLISILIEFDATDKKTNKRSSTIKKATSVTSESFPLQK